MSRIVSHWTEVSAPGAAIRVWQGTLTDYGKQALSISEGGARYLRRCSPSWKAEVKRRAMRRHWFWKPRTLAQIFKLRPRPNT